VNLICYLCKVSYVLMRQINRNLENTETGAAVEWLTLLFSIRKVPGLNLSAKPAVLKFFFFFFFFFVGFLIPSRQMLL
jgi:hypothetical protein